MAYVRSCEKLPPRLIKPVPAGCKTDPPLSRARPVSDGGSASVVTCLSKGTKENSAVKQRCRERSETM